MATPPPQTTNAPRSRAFIRSFLAYLLGVIFRPLTTFQKLLADRQRLTYGWSALLLIGVLYTLVTSLLWIHRNPVSLEPFLRIPTEQYYYWLQFFCLAVYVTSGILAAAIMHLLSKVFHGQGSFEDTLALVGMGTAAATLATLIPDVITSVLAVMGVMADAFARPPGFWQIVTWGYLALYVLLFVVLYPAAVRAVQKIQVWQAVLVGVFGFLVYQSFLLLFIR
jgi:hypothetical protein